jgi:hypothetical protein
VAAIGVACYTVYKTNRSSSVATYVSINEAFRQAWDRFFEAVDQRARYKELCNLMNLLEMSCAIHQEHSLVGISKGMLKTYLNDVLKLLIEDEYANSQIARMMHSSDTFEYIKEFIGEKAKLSVTIPPEWYSLAS